MRLFLHALTVVQCETWRPWDDLTHVYLWCVLAVAGWTTYSLRSAFVCHRASADIDLAGAADTELISSGCLPSLPRHARRSPGQARPGPHAFVVIIFRCGRAQWRHRDSAWRGSSAVQFDSLLLTTYRVNNITKRVLPHLVSKSVFTGRRYASAIYALVVCLSVRPSVRHKPALYQTAKRRIRQTTPYDIVLPGTLVFWRQKYRRNSKGVNPT